MVQQHLAGQIDALLGAADDDDLARLAAHSAHGAQISRDGRLQGWVAAGVMADRQFAARPTPIAGQQAGPDVKGKGGDIGAGGKGRAVVGGGPADRGQVAAPARKAIMAGHILALLRGILPQAQRAHRAPPLGARIGQFRGDIGAVAPAGFHIAFGQKLLQGRRDRVAGERQILGQHPVRRQPAARWQPAIQDHVAQAGIELPV